jgi:hypothetical protein
MVLAPTLVLGRVRVGPELWGSVHVLRINGMTEWRPRPGLSLQFTVEL